MDEELMNVTTEDEIEIPAPEIVETDVDIKPEEINIDTEELAETVEAEQTEEVYIDMSESMGWVGGDNTMHYSMAGRDEPNQHPIEAISGLRSELDEIERIKTVFSDKFNVANYYEWEDAAYDEHGYFVCLAPNTSKIKICSGPDVLGVSVSNAGFIGGQDQRAPRGNSYGLIVTSGLVDVRCELDVEVGDCVVSNVRGYAKKSGSNYGYKVLAKENKDGTDYAVILLGVQADKTNAIGEDLNALDKRVRVNEQNIVSAINVANQAYNKSSEAASSVSVSKEAIEEALKNILGFGEQLDEMEKVVISSNVVATQAQAIAQSAATWAKSARDEAVTKANDSWEKTNNLIDTLTPVLAWQDDETGISGADYLATKMDDGIATTYDVKVVDDKTEIAMNSIQRNGKELQSLMTVIDKYSVGEYSQANGLTLEQAQSILEIGMIYVPTSHKNLSAGTEYHKEEYTYTVGDEIKTYTRWFTPGYLYRWDKIPDPEIGVGWLTIGNNAETNKPEVAEREEDYSSTSVLPSVGPWVFFSHIEPLVSDTWEYGYWFTNGDQIVDASENVSAYEPYTLYKWEKPEGEDGYWFAVATLAGNSNNRATSMIRQTANEIEAKLSNAYGGVAGWEAEMAESYSTVGSLASWKNGEGDVGEAIIKQEAKDDGTSSIVISTLQMDSDGEIEASASLVLSAQKKEDNSGSFLAIDADNINFTASANYSVLAENIRMDADNIRFTATADYSVLAENITLRGDQINFTAGTIANRNLLLNSGTAVTNSSYLTNSYNLSEAPMEGETYTITVNGVLGEGKECFKAYNSSDDVPLTELKQVENTNLYRATFVWTNKNAEGKEVTPTSIRIYAREKTTVVDSTINWAKLEKGVVATVWTAAPEDQVSSDQTNSAMCWKMVPDKCVWWNNNTSESDPLMRLDSTGLYIKGEVNATTGAIGGWKLWNYTLECAPGTYTYGGEELAYGGFGLRTAASGINVKQDPLLAIGWNSGQHWVDSRFCVFADGSVRATRGTIGGNTIDDSGLHITNGNITLGTKFSVASDGVLVANGANITGTITAEGGFIGPVKITKTGLGIENYDGETFLTGSAVGSYQCYFDRGSLGGWGFSDYKIQGLYTYTGTGAVVNYTNNTAANGLYYTQFFPDKLVTKEKQVTVDAEQYIDWGSLTNLALNSDARLKNNIESFPDEYDIFFDMLKPKRYKYNDGLSNRYHTGYIAQEVVQSLEESGLSTLDFAAVMLRYPGTDIERWQLRRDEFVSLNTWQIQKLKARVAELENKIALLTE